MNDLDTLLRTAADPVPEARIDPELLVRLGRSRVRRRRALAGAAVVAVAGLAGTLPWLAAGSDPALPPAQQPRDHLTLADATVARSGADYAVLHTFTAHSTDDGMSGEFVRGVLPDGTIVAQAYAGGRTATRIELVGPGGSRTVEAPRSLENYLGGTATTAIFGAGENGGLWLLDVDTLTWRVALAGQDVDTNVPVQPITASQDRPDHVYYPGSATTAADRRLFEADLGDRSGSVLGRGGDIAAFGGRVAWTAAHDAPNARVTVRDEATGETTSFDPGTGSCDQKGLGLTPDRVVVMVNCRDAGNEQTETDVVDRIDVFDLTGRPLAQITGAELGPVRMTDRFLTLSSRAGDRTGTYTYDLATGRFLKVTDSVSGLAGAETGTGSTLVWQQRLDGDSGATYVVAAMR